MIKSNQTFSQCSYTKTDYPQMIQRLDEKTHFIFSHKKHKDRMYSNRKIKGGRKETTFYCDTCDRKAGIHQGECFKNFHTLKNYK